MSGFDDFERVSFSKPGMVSGLPQDAADTLGMLFDEWSMHYEPNLMRSTYFNGREKVRNLAVSIPDTLARRVNSMVGWPAKAVRALADLSQFEGLACDGDDTLGLAGIAYDACLDVTVQQAVTSAYKHGCAFLASYLDADGTPRVMCRSALMSSALWDMERQEPASAMTITGVDAKTRQVTSLMLFLPGRAFDVRKSEGRWTATGIMQAYEGVAVTPVCSDPQLDKPLGRSMITRPLISYTDAAIRTLVRMEATAEFYAIPKLWFLGLEDDAFDTSSWSALVSSINGITRDVDGNVPQLEQVQQASMQPHADMLATLARMAAGETDLPVSDFGIISSNPTSAEAMAEAERKLTRRADRQNRLFARAVKRALGIAWCARENQSRLPDLSAYTPVFASTREESAGARADYFQKVASVSPSYASTDIAWRQLGFDADSARVLSSASRGQQALDGLTALLGDNVEGAHDVDEAGAEAGAQSGQGGQTGVQAA